MRAISYLYEEYLENYIKTKYFSTNLFGQGQSPPLMSKLGPPPPPRPLKPIEKQLVNNFTAALIQTNSFQTEIFQTAQLD